METQTYPISPEGTREYKLHLISQLFDQLRFIRGNRKPKTETADTEMFDALYDKSITELEQCQNSLEQRVKEVAEYRSNPTLRESRAIEKRVIELKETIRALYRLRLSTVEIEQERMKLIERWKKITGKSFFPL